MSKYYTFDIKLEESLDITYSDAKIEESSHIFDIYTNGGVEDQRRSRTAIDYRQYITDG